MLTKLSIRSIFLTKLRKELRMDYRIDSSFRVKTDYKLRRYADNYQVFLQVWHHIFGASLAYIDPVKYK